MIDFIIDLFIDIGAFFIDLWVNKIAARFSGKRTRK